MAHTNAALEVRHCPAMLLGMHLACTGRASDRISLPPCVGAVCGRAGQARTFRSGRLAPITIARASHRHACEGSAAHADPSHLASMLLSLVPLCAAQHTLGSFGQGPQGSCRGRCSGCAGGEPVTSELPL